MNRWEERAERYKRYEQMMVFENAYRAMQALFAQLNLVVVPPSRELVREHASRIGKTPYEVVQDCRAKMKPMPFVKP